MDIEPNVEERPFSDPRRWYEEHYPLVSRAMLRWGVPRAGLEDAIQEAFIAAYRRRRTFAGGSVAAWLYAIARRVASNARRTELRRDRRREALARTQALRPKSAAPERGAAVVVVERFLQQLPPQHGEAFALSELEGLTGPEIAQCMGWNLATTYGRIRELRMRFAAHCDDPASTLVSQRKHRPRPSHAAVAAFLERVTVPWVPPAAAAPSTLASVATSVLLASVVLVGVYGVAQALGPQPPVTVRAAVSPPRSSEAPPASRAAQAVTVKAVPASIAPTVVPVAHGEPPTAPPRAADRRTPPPPTRTGTSPPPPAKEASQSALALAAVAIRQDRFDDALALVEAHARQRPDSPLGDVRAALRIEALCGLDRPRAADHEAESFVVDYPTSPALARVRGGCRR